MVEDLRLPATRREKTGTSETRRLRLAGRVPVNVYGLGRSSESLSACKDVVEKLVATRSSVVDLELDGEVSKAVVQELQWDVFSTHVQHIDLRLVDPDGRISTEVPVEVRGEPAALKEGAQLRLRMKTVRVNCPDYRIPKALVARVGALQAGQTVTAAELPIPETATLETDAAAVVVELFHPRKAAVADSEGSAE
jgi:large subunit ribosomal protein L25